MLTALAGQSESNWKQATGAAELAITCRIKLWDSVLTHVKHMEEEKNSHLLVSNRA
jgi:hypothetical protein